ncbi:MAG: hypothetical protein ACRELY_18155 [Polyangiaceae bacterium]
MSTTTTTIETQGTTVENTESEKKVEGVVGTLLDLGFAWAAYGLKIATSAVEHASKVCSITAEALDKLADEFAQKAKTEGEARATESAK